MSQYLWQNIGGDEASPNLAVVSGAPNALDVFVVRSAPGQHRVFHKALNGTAWNPPAKDWEDLGDLDPVNAFLAQSQSPVALARSATLRDVFAVSIQGNAYRKRWDGATWSGWENLGAPIGGFIGMPAVCGHLTDSGFLFVRGNDKAVHGKSLIGKSLGTWSSLGGATIMDPTALHTGGLRVDLFTVGDKYQLLHKWFTAGLGAAWLPSQTGWEDLGGFLTGSPTAVGWGANRIDVFAPGKDNQGYCVLHKWWNGSAWSSWERLTGPGVTHLRAISWGPNHIDLFARGGGAQPGDVYRRWFDGVWHPAPDADWESLGGNFYPGNGPEAVAWAPGRLDVFMVADQATDGDANVYHRWWDGAWKPSQIVLPPLKLP
jgi:hypothetical protein